MKPYKILGASVVIILCGCADIKLVPFHDQYKKHEESTGVKYKSCDLSHYQDGGQSKYGYKYEVAAVLAFPYAMMASNAYDDVEQFEVPGWRRVERYQSGMGLSADVYERSEKGLPAKFFSTSDKSIPIEYQAKDRDAIAVVFRGTEFFKPNDWIFGNLNIYWMGQFKDADQLIDKIVDKKNNKNRIIYAIGHSLGGALAIHVSLTHDHIYALGFDSSPRFFDTYSHENEKHTNGGQFVIEEKGEVLQGIRRIWPTMKVIDESVDFNFATGWSVFQHSMYNLARGLTIVAAAAGDDSAKWAMEKNIGCKISAIKSP
ncbi:MAG: hypothetical protein RLY71_2892 [Pseudomonadota bacterium]|jgi:pimeloyl-ACP methyl ester carboxylesterase